MNNDNILRVCNTVQPFRNARGKLFDMEDTGDNLKVIKDRLDLAGRPATP